ncbi:S1 family peptidase [Streptomyces sp. NPDC051322]|uniref:S1 family peptidase n=1 Tax=Streptomyces sp. NPDC051322 TaxID=3154645 RepID=UPI00344C9DC3
MRKATVLRAVLSAGLLLTATTVGLTEAVADGTSTPSPVSAARQAPASDDLLSAMQRDLGLTRTEAVGRLAAETAARQVERSAKRAAGHSYGGSWFDATSGKLVVALTRTGPRKAVEATGARVTLVQHSERQLNSTMKRVNALHAPVGVAGWHVDPRNNSVTLDVVAAHNQDNDVRSFVARARKAGPVTVSQTDHTPRTLAAGTVGGDPYYTGNVRCSIGFSVSGGFISAGHCAQPGAAVYGWDHTYIGNFQGSSFPDNDYSWVNVGSGWWTVPVVLGWGTVPDQLVRGSAEAPIGGSICRSGSTSHWHCGTVLAKNETVNYSEGAVHEMTKTNVCAEPGDSGGSFISGDQAQGVTSGGWGNCSSGGETWYQPVNEILNRYHLTLTTA